MDIEFNGSFSFLFIFQIPIVNYIKWRHPETKINVTGLEGEDYYYKNEFGHSIIDSYIDTPQNANVRRECDKYMTRFRQMPRRYVRAGLYAEKSLDDSDYVIFCSRYHKAYADLNPNGNRHANSDFNCDYEYLKLLSKEIKVYITGLPNECYEFNDIDNVESIVNIPLKKKPPILLSLTNNALGVISTAASAIATYGMCVGTPTMCFNTHRYHKSYGTPDGNNRSAALNPFGTYNQCYKQINPNAQHRFEQQCNF